MTATELSNVVSISFQAANTALQSLVDRNVVRERTGHARNRIFAAEEVLALIGRPFGETPEKALKRSREKLLRS